MGKVSIVKTTSGIKKSLDTALKLIGGIQLVVQKEDHVLLKPNLNDFDCITSIDLVEALIQYLFDHSVKQIVIAESTFGNKQITEVHFKKSGYYRLSDTYNIPLINLNASEPVELVVENPLILGSLKIAKEVLDATKIINLPVMKVHYATGVTLGLKNLKGFLSPEEKKHFHKVGVEKAIVDLNTAIPVDLTITDGIMCMERMGPKGGDVFELGLLLAGREIAEVDYIACGIMGYTVEEVKHLMYYMEKHNTDVSKITTYGEKPGDVTRPFARVKMDTLIPPGITVYNQNACSACMNALLLSFRFIKTDILKSTGVFLGDALPEVTGNEEVTVAFGNCCMKKDATIIVKGCPPYPFLLKEKLS